MATSRPKGKGYEITVSLGYRVDGSKIMKSEMWYPDPGMTPKKTAKALEEEKVLFEKKCRSGEYIDKKIKLADFSEQWMQKYVSKNCKKTTYNRYSKILVRINQSLGHKMIGEIQPQHLLEFYENLQEGGVRGDTKYKPLPGFDKILKDKRLTHVKVAESAGVSVSVLKSCAAGRNVAAKSAQKVAKALDMDTGKLFKAIDPQDELSGNTVLYYHRLLSSMFSTAVKWQIIYSNPCSRVDPPKAEHVEAKYLDEVEAAQLLELIEAESVQFRAMIKLLIFTGMRRGELCGLEWDDIDLDKRTMHIQRNSLYLPGEGIFEDTTKSYTSDRIIKLSLTAVEMLKSFHKWQADYIQELGDQWIGTGRLFTKWDGAPIHPDTITGWFGDFAKKNDLQGIHIHSLRHTNATLLIAGGTPLVTVQKRLGHAAQTTTANIYSHAIKSMDAVAAAVLDDILRPPTTQILNKKA